MKKIDTNGYLQALEDFLSRYISPCCKPTEKEQGFIDGVSYCKHLIKFFAEEEGYDQITLEDYMKDCQWL